MLVIAGAPESGTEERVFGWLRSWSGEYEIPGIALTNLYVAGQEVDLIIVTPYTTVTLEIKGTHPGVPADGVLICTANRRWEVPGFAGDPVRVRAGDTTPYDQARAGALKVKRVVSRVGSGAFDRSLVLVVPPRGSTLRLDKRSAPGGCTVLLCESHNRLRAWFHGAHRQGGIVWTAEQAYALVDALECGNRTTVAELAAEGFPLERANPLPAPSPPIARPAAPRLPASTAPESARPHPPPAPQPDRRDDPVHRPAEVPRPVRARPPVPAADGRRDVLRTVAAFAAIAVLGAGLWFSARPDEDNGPEPVRTEQSISPVTAEPTAPVPPPAPAGARPPAPPPAGESCFPFQPNC